MKVIIEVEDSIYRDEYYIEKHSGVGIKKEYCQIVDDNVRLTEERADKLYDDLCTIYSHNKEEWFAQMKQKGWIIETKTAKEELEEYYKKNNDSWIDKIDWKNLYKLAQKAIKEAEEK